ncbi:CheR family methyltransferase [Magnetococcales bacterium HHB-1]
MLASANRLGTSTPIIRHEEFYKFRDFFYRKTGIFYDEVKRPTVELRLSRQIIKTGYNKFRDYFNYLRFQASGEELQNLINVMTVNETYFIREETHLQCLVNRVLDEIMHFKKPGEILKLWSMPCSTGEEPYSLAIYLLERWAAVDQIGIAISASDIDTSVLHKAQQGVFGQRSVAPLPPAWLKRYFKRVDHNQFLIAKDLRESIDFSKVNLNDAAQTRRFRNFDVIFCRNLLIYFNPESRRRAAETFFDALNPGGFLFLGHSESMSRISSLYRVRRFSDTIVYQKPNRRHKQSP